MTPLGLLTLASLGWAFNLDPRHAVVLDDPESDRGSYFGYALAFWRQSFHGQNTTWLLVGAPQAQEEGLKGERVRQPGAVYKCRVDDVDDPTCHRVTILGQEDRQEQDLRWRWKTMNIPKRGWIGATITVENKPNGAVVVCAPRMKQMLHKDTWFIPGMCFYWKTDSQISPLAALETAYKSGSYHRKNGFFIGLAQSGMAAHFVENSTTSQLVVGAPGVDYFTGAMNIYEKDNPFSKEIPSLHIPKMDTNPHNYLGYSVTSAKLYSDGRVSYLAGAPRDKGMDFFTGSVYVMSGAHQSKWSLETKLEGQQMGEYFGACVAAVDIDLDGTDDLVLVGAPLHSLRQTSTVDEGEQGRLYVYRNTGQGRLELAPVVLTGSSVAGARFASSVTSIGDLNRDGYNDIAVGAPYEGNGAVYVYLGSRHGLGSSYAQRIFASDIRSDLSGFGISLASGIDLDGNSFNDLAIGSYDSGNVVIIKSYPIIEMDGTIQPSVSNLDVNANSIAIKVCLAYTTNADINVLSYVDAVAVLKADSTFKRAHFESGSHVQEIHVRLQRDQTHCWDIPLSLKVNLVQKMHPVEFSMDYRVSNDPHTKDKKFCKMCPVTDPLKPSSVHVKVPFANGCGGRSVCMADLKVVAESSNNDQAIILGENTKITLAVSIVNSKEPAYLAKMSLILPKTTSLYKMPKHCYLEEEGSIGGSEEDVILCGLGNILEADQRTKRIVERTTNFEIDVSNVGLDTSLLVFNITTWSASEELTPNDNSAIIKVPVKLVSEVEIAGNTLQKHLILSSKDEKLPSVISVIHKYEVTNLGPSTVGQTNIISSLPFGLIIDDNIGVITFAESINPQITINGHTQSCSVDHRTLKAGNKSRRKRDISALETDETETYLSKNVFHLNCSESDNRRAACATVTCAAGPLRSGDTAEVKLQFNINKTMIDLIQQKDIIQITSTGWTEICGKYEIPSGKRLKLTHVATLLVGNFEETISPWALLLSTIVGLFLFSFMVQVLSKAGFFRRKYKENMETMRDAAEEFAYQKFLPEFERNIFF